jgi:hypothetical protein
MPAGPDPVQLPRIPADRCEARAVSPPGWRHMHCYAVGHEEMPGVSVELLDAPSPAYGEVWGVGSWHCTDTLWFLL